MLELPVLKLGDLEIAVMESVWSLGEADVKRVHAEIGVTRGVTSNTIQSTLERLYRKKLLARRKVSHSFLYAAAVDRAGLVTQAIDAVLDRFSQGDTGLVLSALVGLAARTDVKTLSELEKLIDRQTIPPDGD